MSEAVCDNLTITNRFIFGKVMQEPMICKHFLEKLLGMKIKKINYPEREKEIGILPESHDVRLDIYADDESDTFYDVEMQSYRQKDLPLRSRYYQSMLDMNYLESGDDYSVLPKSFVIFICDYDVFGWDIPVLSFRYTDEKNKDKVLDDGTYRIFLCRTPHFEEADIDDDIKAFLRYMGGKKNGNAFVEKVDNKVEEIMLSEKFRIENMSLNAERMDARREGRQEGIKEGERRAQRRAQKEISEIRHRAEVAESENLRLRELLQHAGILVPGKV